MQSLFDACVCMCGLQDTIVANADVLRAIVTLTPAKIPPISVFAMIFNFVDELQWCVARPLLPSASLLERGGRHAANTHHL